MTKPKHVREPNKIASRHLAEATSSGGFQAADAVAATWKSPFLDQALWITRNQSF
jgi:hypothetical protein